MSLKLDVDTKNTNKYYSILRRYMVFPGVTQPSTSNNQLCMYNVSVCVCACVRVCVCE